MLRFVILSSITPPHFILLFCLCMMGSTLNLLRLQRVFLWYTPVSGIVPQLGMHEPAQSHIDDPQSGVLRLWKIYPFIYLI